jgi:hypothetical protein
MKKLIVPAIAILVSCTSKKTQAIEIQTVKCVVTSVHEEYKYGGLTNEKYYYFSTDKGYRGIHSEREINVGDTVMIEVHSLK